MAVVAACFIDRKTTDFECTTTADCDGDLVCRDSYCIVDEGTDDIATDTDDLTTRLRAAPAAAKFFDPTADWAPEGDFALCAALDAVPFAVALGRCSEDRPELRPWPGTHGERRAAAP